MNDVTDLFAQLGASRILVIDDNRAIHQDFRKIFGAGRGRSAPSAAELALLGDSAEPTAAQVFRIDSAYQGQEGLELVRLAQEERNPYAMAFVDVRMPPGWDGIETTAQIWKQDPDIQIVICTAYSDYSWGEMLAKLGRSDRLVILKKPFDTIEVLQLASALTEKWRLARQSRSLVEGLEHRVAVRTRELMQTVDDLSRSKAVEGAILATSLDCVVTIDHEGKVVEFNPAAETTFGWTRAQALGKDMVELIVPPRLRDAHRRGFAHYLATGEGPILGKRLELSAIRADGTEFPIELAINALRATSQPMFTGFIRDITARKQADEKIRRLNRVYAVLSGINTLIVRVRDRDELFREACRMAVEAGGFRMAWVGLVDRKAGIVRPAATAGDVRDFFATAPLAITDATPNLSGRAIREMKPVISNDTHNDPQRIMKREFLERGINSLAIIPLLVGGEAAGLLALYSTEVGFFDDEEMRLLLELAGDIAFAIEHIEKAEKLARMTRVNAMLSGINGAIVRIRDRRALFEEACRIAVEAGSLPFVSMTVVDETEMRLRPAASAGDDGGFLATLHDRLSLRDDSPAGHGISARSVRQKRALVLNDVENAPEVKNKKALAARGIRSMAAFPLLVEAQAVGAFALHSAEVGFFDDEEMKLLQEVAGNIAFALEHIEKEEKVQRLTRVYAVLSGINTLIVRVHGRDELFMKACRIAVEEGGFRMAWIGIVDRAAQRILPAASAGANAGFLADPRQWLSLTDDSPGPAVMAVRDKRAVVVDEVDSDPRMHGRRAHLDPRVRSLVILPLLVGGEPVGVFGLHALETGYFDEKEMKLLRELAGDIAFAIDHIDAAAKLERTTRMNAMLSAVNAAIVRIRDRHALFEEACRIAVSAGGFILARVVELDVNGKARIAANTGTDSPQYQRLVDEYNADAGNGETLLARAMRSGQPTVSNDVVNDPRVPGRAVLIQDGTFALAVLPIVVDKHVAGAMVLRAREPGMFDEDELRLLVEVVSNIAFALEHMDKEKKVQRLTRVYAVLSGINALIVRVRERDELFNGACAIAVGAGGFKVAWVALADRTAMQLKVVASEGADPDYLARMPLSLNEADEKFGLSGRAVCGDSPVIVEDMEHDPRVLLHREAGERDFHSLVMLPLRVSDTVVGVLALYANEIGFFNDSEMKLLLELAGDISFAIDHIGKQERLDYLAYYDALTGLANRTLFLERVAQYMRSAVSAGHKLALFLVDLQRFKNINDSLGQAAGDALLKQVAQWLAQEVGDVNLLARIDADHFAVVLPKVRQDGSVARLLDKAMDAFEEHPFHLGAGVFRVATKTGVALFPDDGATADALFKNAEAALKKAKASGDRHLLYTPQMTDAVAGKLTLENQLRHALDNGEFVLHYQPKVSFLSGKLTGVEALIRWNDPRTGLVPPGRFIPILEETGMISEVGRWALRKAVEDYLRWLNAGLPAVRIAVNVSPLQLRNRDFTAEVAQAIAIDPRAPAGLELEITENLIMEDVKHSIATLRAVRDLGVTIAIDDFGTGFSSLSYLSKLPVDTLKIDRSFVIEMTAPEGRSLVPAIIGLAHSLKLKVVAEGVETEDQSRLLRLLGCDEMQGYLFSKPVPGEVLEARFLAASVSV